MKRARFYHWWVYKLFYKTWTPLLQHRPDLVVVIRDHMNGWLARNEGSRNVGS